MSGFVVAMLAGLLGLVAMAIPGFRRHGAGRLGHANLHGAHGARGAHALASHKGAPPRSAGTSGHPASASNWIPEPRAMLSVLTLFGAFGNLFDRHLGWSVGLACGAAFACAVVLEAAMVGPLWRWSLRFQGQPATPLAALVLEEAFAVTAFRNGRGIVRVVRDGRTVQLPARLIAAHADQPVKVGARLRIQDVETEKEWVQVALD